MDKRNDCDKGKGKGTYMGEDGDEDTDKYYPPPSSKRLRYLIRHLFGRITRWRGKETSK